MDDVSTRGRKRRISGVLDMNAVTTAGRSRRSGQAGKSRKYGTTPGGRTPLGVMGPNIDGWNGAGAEVHARIATEGQANFKSRRTG